MTSRGSEWTVTLCYPDAGVEMATIAKQAVAAATARSTDAIGLHRAGGHRVAGSRAAPWTPRGGRSGYRLSTGKSI